MTFRLPPAERRIVGASEEVIRHHAGQHECGPDVDQFELLCPCGRSVLIMCSRCNEPVFGVAAPGGIMCGHLAEIVFGGDA